MAPGYVVCAEEVSADKVSDGTSSATHRDSDHSPSSRSRYTEVVSHGNIRNRAWGSSIFDGFAHYNLQGISHFVNELNPLRLHTDAKQDGRKDETEFTDDASDCVAC